MGNSICGSIHSDIELTLTPEVRAQMDVALKHYLHNHLTPIITAHLGTAIAGMVESAEDAIIDIVITPPPPHALLTLQSDLQHVHCVLG